MLSCCRLTKLINRFNILIVFFIKNPKPNLPSKKNNPNPKNLPPPPPWFVSQDPLCGASSNTILYAPSPLFLLRSPTPFYQFIDKLDEKGANPWEVLNQARSSKLGHSLFRPLWLLLASCCDLLQPFVFFGSFFVWP